MQTLVERLRTQPPIYGPLSDTQQLRNEAANEIDRLTAENAELRKQNCELAGISA